MPNLWWLSRQDAPEMGDASLAALLAGAEPAEGLAPGLQPLADALAALTVRADRDELAGEAAALAEFENRVGVPVPVSRSRHRRHPLPTSLLSARAAAAAAVAALGLGGFATAAFAGALPAPAQQFAHHTFGAPAARRRPAHRHTSQRDRHASWSGRHRSDGVRAVHRLGARQSTRHLQPAGGGLPQPGRCRRWRQQRNRLLRCRAAPRASSSHSSHPTGPPASHPTGPPTSHPTGPPTSPPTGPPASHPTGPPTS